MKNDYYDNMKARQNDNTQTDPRRSGRTKKRSYRFEDSESDDFVEKHEESSPRNTPKDKRRNTNTDPWDSSEIESSTESSDDEENE